MKLAHRYTILFLVVVVVAGGVLFATFDQHRSDVTENAEASVQDRSDRMATSLDHELNEQQRIVAFAASDDRLLDQQSDSQRSVLESFVETTEFDGVSVVDETGEVQSLMTTDSEKTDMVGYDLSNREYVQRALGGQQYVSEPLEAETDNLIVVISAPVKDDGEVVGTINGAYHLEKTDVFESLTSEEEVKSVTVESGDLELFSTVETAETINASADLETADWTVTAHHRTAAVDSSIERLGLIQGLMGLVLLGTLTTFGGWVYRSQIVQIGHILDQLNALKRREYDSEYELGGGTEWEEIEEALTELREALAQREQMLLVHNRILRHNLRNKLNVIRSQAEMLDADVDGESSAETTEIHRATEKLLQLADRARTTERLLDPPENDARTDVTRVVHERAARIQESEPSLSVTVSAPESVHAACGTEISTAIDELLQNVADHGGSGPTATVTVAAAGEHVVIRVEDDGPGIPESEASVIAGDHDITQLRHTVGIGLWLVDWIVSRYDGSLRVPQTRDGGSVVEIELHRAPTTEAGPDELPGEEPTDDESERSAGTADSSVEDSAVTGE